MTRKRDPISQKLIFQSVVQNAIDFFQKSIAELRKNPKYSVINFCSAIELFLKARLMLEHWSLIITKPEQANFQKFMIGDFQAVSMDGALERLENVGGQAINKDERKCFDQIREHRNKLVHFYHSKYIGNTDKKTIQSIVSEQCKGWFYLHRSLTENWKTEFSAYGKDIAQLDQLMRKQRTFLTTKYDLLKSQIKEESNKGILYFTCFSCGFKSLRKGALLQPLMERKCHVCNATRDILEVSCPKCEKPIYVEDMGAGKCDYCGQNIDIEYLVNVFGEEELTKDYLSDPTHAFCDVCEYISRPTVVPFDDQWLCLWCLTLHERVDTCDWCSERSTGDLSDSSYLGCVLCQGSLGRDD